MTGRSLVSIHKQAQRGAIGRKMGPGKRSTWVFTDTDVAYIRGINPKGGRPVTTGAGLKRKRLKEG